VFLESLSQNDGDGIHEEKDSEENDDPGSRELLMFHFGLRSPIVDHQGHGGKGVEGDLGKFGGAVTLRWKAEAGQGVIEVEDTGIGIPGNQLPRIFERFYRVDRHRSRDQGGTGLGLSIVKHLVQSVGGKITVESRLNVGSTFRIRIPLAEQKPTNGQPASTTSS